MDKRVNQTEVWNTVPVTDPALNYKTYSDATYKYYCESAGGSAVGDPAWRVTRVTIADGTTTYAGTATTFGSFTFLATNLAAVQGLTYNNGVAL